MRYAPRRHESADGRLAGPALAFALVVLAIFGLLGTPALPGADEGNSPNDEPPQQPAPPLQRIDFHTHLHPAARRAMLGLMDTQGIEIAVNLSSAPAGPTLDVLLQMGRESKGRILTFAGPDWRQLAFADAGDRMAADLARAVAQGARGLKISKALGLAVPAPEGGLLAIDDPRLSPLFEKAGELQIPVAIHVADPVAFWEPLDHDNERYDELALHPEWSYANRAVPSHAELLAQSRRLYAAHPHTEFVGVHLAGIPEDLDELTAMLDAHPNLSVDLAARIPEIGRQEAARVRAFFLRYADRILFGTDLGLGPNGIMLGAPLAWRETRADVQRFFDATWRFLETRDRQFEHPTPIQGRWRIDGIGLPRRVLEKVYFDNAARLLHLDSAPGH